MPDIETKTWIQSASGLKIDLLHPNPKAIRIEDIAYALAGINRFTGHARPRYNVAEHSVRVSRLAARLAPRYDNEQIMLCAKWGLLHDATEAYLGDVSRPLKNCPELAGYKRLEKAWEAVIADRFGLPREMPACVTKADYWMLGIEADQLMRPIHPEWGATCPGGFLPPPDRTQTLGWSPEHAESCFLQRFETLFSKLFIPALASGSEASSGS